MAAVSLAVFAWFRHTLGASMVDMLVYRAEGGAVVRGEDLYAMRLPGWDLPATYPPFAALLFVPSTWFDVSTLRVLVMLLNYALLATAVHLSLDLAGRPRRHRAAVVVLATGLGIWLEPVFTTFRYGQVNLGILCLVLWDLTRPDRDRCKGVGIGLAAAVKITPGLFAVYLLLTGRVRAALVSAGTFLAAGLTGWAVLPDASYGFWTGYLWDPGRVGSTVLVDNQSLRGAVCRLLDAGDPGLVGLVAPALAGTLGLGVAVTAGRSARVLRRADAWGAVCAALTALLVSPISWTHHWVWCVPLIALLASEAGSRARQVLFGLTVLVFLSHAMWRVPSSMRWGRGVAWYWQLPGAVYPSIAIAVLAVLGVRLYRARRPAVDGAGGGAGVLSAAGPGRDPALTAGPGPGGSGHAGGPAGTTSGRPSRVPQGRSEPV
ncbi:glycosyltransferase 87 family protein [Streptomyces sp. CBMA156]|uniref:glycosyltransferase 87 family protein n=2 Tax=Streptomyces sp. CBMA156 TaxID=1930280 RepID=UPI002950039E|nr:glycosyltransferase 87 family protein [Streptomyces sp. CBMA156]